jgi:hypothetical protein
MAALSQQHGCGDTRQYAREALQVGGAIGESDNPSLCGILTEYIYGVAYRTVCIDTSPCKKLHSVYNESTIVLANHH